MNNTFKSLILIFLVNISFQEISMAASWRFLSKNQTTEFFYDTSSIIGTSEDKKLSIKENIFGELRNGVMSRLVQLSVNCNESTYVLESIKTFDQPDLTGTEKMLNITNPQRREAKPNTFSQKFVDTACGKLSGNSINTAKVNENRIKEEQQKAEAEERERQFKASPEYKKQQAELERKRLADEKVAAEKLRKEKEIEDKQRAVAADNRPRYKINEYAPLAAHCTGRLARMDLVKVQTKQYEDAKFFRSLIQPLREFALKNLPEERVNNLTKLGYKHIENMSDPATLKEDIEFCHAISKMLSDKLAVFE